ncbi:MAG: CobB/CobQ-like glutamine amidotransferase domain-containing protein, partial [Candidatus Kentron sp. G]
MKATIRAHHAAGRPILAECGGMLYLLESLTDADGHRAAMVLRPSKFEGHCPMIRHGCRMALMVALNWSVECVKEE